MGVDEQETVEVEARGVTAATQPFGREADTMHASSSGDSVEAAEAEQQIVARRAGGVVTLSSFTAET